MDTACDVAAPDTAYVWGVRCGGDGEVLWVRDEGAARRLQRSLVGAQGVVVRASGRPPSEAPITA